MKKALYWLMGERAGRTIVATWNWLWGMPVESGGKIAVEVAQESLRSMQESVWKLTQSVATVSASYQRAKEKYDAKVREFRQFEQQAILAQRNGHEDAARLAMSKAILVEHLLPQLEQQVIQAEQIVMNAREKLNREREHLETYKTHMQNLKDLSEINEALAAVTQATADLKIDSARNQFAEAEAAIQGQYQRVKAQAELAENPTEKLSADLEQMTLDDEISRRLNLLNFVKE